MSQLRELAMPTGQSKNGDTGIATQGVNRPTLKIAGKISSKPLRRADDSGARLSMRALGGDPTYSLNLDAIQFNKKLNRYIVFEYQKCDRRQFFDGITPHTSHPSRYWHRCWRKYVGLWAIVTKLDARFFIINYAEEGTPCEDEICVMEVTGVVSGGIATRTPIKMNFNNFSTWYRSKNLECA